MTIWVSTKRLWKKQRRHEVFFEGLCGGFFVGAAAVLSPKAVVSANAILTPGARNLTAHNEVRSILIRLVEIGNIHLAVCRGDTVVCHIPRVSVRLKGPV
jgi:hypothetical protein